MRILRGKSSSPAGSTRPTVHQHKGENTMLENLKDLLLNEKTKGVIAIVAALTLQENSGS
jgi:hypothetical protein